MLVGAVIWIGPALATSGWVLVELFCHHVEAQARDRLVTDMDQLIAAVTVAPDGAVAIAQPLSDPRFGHPFSDLLLAGRSGGHPRGAVTVPVGCGASLPADEVRDGQVHVHAIPSPREADLLSAERVVRWP